MALKMSVTGTLGYLTDRSLRCSVNRADQLLRQRFSTSDRLHYKDLVGHYGCVNAIEFSHGLGRYVASGGDDRRVLIWDVEKALSDIGKPTMMRGEHNSNIFCVAFDAQNETAFSGGNDEQVIVHDLTTGETRDVFSHEDAVYGLSPDPTNSKVFASSCDDGRVLIYDTRDSCADPFCLANYTSSMHSVMYNPVEPRLLATANAKEGVGLWDVRKPGSCLLRYGGSFVQQSCMSVRFNQRGDRIIALRRRLPPVLYNIDSHLPVCEFDHSGYYNSCTMKSICFAGDNDQYVLSGSDEFNLYMWALPDDMSERSFINSAHMVLKGHRSIVNQVRFNPANHLIISSGVEKVIKVWSPFKLPVKQIKEERNVRSRDRRVYSHEEYINLVLQNGNVMSHDYSQESTDEDPRMMAFFDSLVQRELDGWSSDDSMSSNEEALYSRIVQLSQSDIDSDDSIFDLGENDTEDPAYSPFTIAFASVMASQAVEGNDNFPRLNSALENAERIYAEASDDHGAVQTSEDVNHSPDSENFGQRSVSNVDEENTSHRELTTLVKRKKLELRESMKRKLKYPEIFLSSSDENDDVCGTDDSSVSSLNIVIGEGCQGSPREKTMSLCKTLEANKSLVVNTQAHIKLQRLKSLRKSVMNSESDTSDIEIHKKKLPAEILEPSTSHSSKSEEMFEKVQFKKFKRRNTTDKSAKETDTNGLAKSISSPDYGPFLQKTGASTSIEVRQTSREEEKGMIKGEQSSDTFSSKSKHKSKSDHSHFYKQATKTYDSKRTYVSEQTRNIDSETGFLKTNSSHPKHRHYRDNKVDHTDGKTDTSHRHKEGMYDCKDSESAKSHGHEHRSRYFVHTDGRDSHRYADEERNYDFKNGKESSYNKKGDKTDMSHKHVHERTRINHKDDKNSQLHEREVKYYKNDGKTDNSQRHVQEKTSHHHKDCKDSHRHEHEFKIYDHIDGKMEKESERHRKLSNSDSYSGFDFEERRYKYYAERSENKHIHEHSHERQDNKLDKMSHGGRKSTYCTSSERKHPTSDSEDSRLKRQKQTHHKFSDKIKVDGDKSDDWHSHRNDLVVSQRGHSESNSAHIELQLTDKCKECAKLKGNEKRFDCDNEDRDLTSDKSLCEQCKCLLDNTYTAVTLVSDSKLKTDCENSDNGNESDEERKSSLKKNSKNVGQIREPEPSCSYTIMSGNSDSTKNDERNNSGKCGIKTKEQKIKYSESEDSEMEGHCQNDSKKATYADSIHRRDSSSNEEDQLTWKEFKRFKKRLERARKRYMEEKHQRRNESRHSDNK